MLLPICLEQYDEFGMPVVSPDGKFVEFIFFICDEFVTQAALGKSIEIFEEWEQEESCD